jgi:outer membrane protein
LAQTLVEQNKKRVEVGAMAPLDEQQAEAQAASSQADLIAARNTLTVQENVVKQLITDRYSEWQPLSLEPSGTLAAPKLFFDLQNSWSRGLTQRPEFLQAKLDVEKAGIQLKYDRNQLFPELDVFATYGFNGSGQEFSGVLYNIQRRDLPFYTYGGKITIPLGNTTARNTYKADKATREQVVLALKKLEQNIMIQIDNDIKQAQSNFERVQATRAARQYAEAALDAEQKKLENGKSTTYTVLQMQRDLTTARGNEIQALAAYNKSLSQLSLDEGGTLDRLGISVEVK